MLDGVPDDSAKLSVYVDFHQGESMKSFEVESKVVLSDAFTTPSFLRRS